jgi:hypothetical protein
VLADSHIKECPFTPASSLPPGNDRITRLADKRGPLALPTVGQRRMRVACCVGSTGENAMT